MSFATALLNTSSSISVAESVTAGHIQALLSMEENATQFFQGGITVYNLGQKARHLGVDPILAQRCNCVSQQVAEQMSIGVARLFLSDYGLAITGYAAPVPEENIYDLFAWVALSFHGQIIVSQKITPANKEMKAVQKEYAAIALQLFPTP